VKIFASSGLDELAVQQMLAVRHAPIDGFGIGSSLDTSHDAPSLDCAYKLQEYAGVARRKRSEGKATWPGRKQVLRRYTASGHMAGDLLALENEGADGEPLLRPAMRDGQRVQPAADLLQARERCRRDLERLPQPLRALEPAAAYPVQVSDALQRLAAEVDRRQAGAAAS
jgi:nicotinate phosphoribosyltransferase